MQPDCAYCAGEACALCIGAPRRPQCEHDSEQRHGSELCPYVEAERYREQATKAQRDANAAENAWLHDEDLTQARRPQLRRILSSQLLTVGRGFAPACACCRVLHGFAGLYRCYQCGLWLCPMCSAVHFPNVVRS